MADLILPERFTSQPQYAAPVDRSNPSSRGLVFLYSAAANADAALLGPPTLQNTGSLGATARGVALQGNAAG